MRIWNGALLIFIAIFINTQADVHGALTVSESKPGSLRTPWHFIITASLWGVGLISNSFLEMRTLGFWDLSDLAHVLVDFGARFCTQFCLLCLKGDIFKVSSSLGWAVWQSELLSSVHIYGFLPDPSGYKPFFDACRVPAEGQDLPHAGEGRVGLLQVHWGFLPVWSISCSVAHLKPFKMPVGLSGEVLGNDECLWSGKAWGNSKLSA